MDQLALFGLFSLAAMLLTYAFDDRCHWFTLAFAGFCLLAPAYGFCKVRGRSASSNPAGRWLLCRAGGIVVLDEVRL